MKFWMMNVRSRTCQHRFTADERAGIFTLSSAWVASDGIVFDPLMHDRAIAWVAATRLPCDNRRMSLADLIIVHPDILGGTPVFKGTRAPVKTLFEYLENNYLLNEFLECFPSVTGEMARGMLERSQEAALAAAA